MGLQRWWSAAADLAVGADCASCGAPGLGWCAACAAACRPGPRHLPELAGVPVVAVVDNAGPMARVVVAWKDRGRLRMTGPMGHLLAVGCATLPLGESQDRGRLGLVPVPTSPVQARRRGADPVGLMAAGAERELQRAGIDAVVLPLLRRVRETRDQVGLGASGREANVAGAFAAVPGALARAARAGVDRVVVVDDVLTSGASAREALRALDAGGLRVAGVVVVAHTPAPGTGTA